MEKQYILSIVWVDVELPDLVGPFSSETEAERWAEINVPNGISVVRQMAYPYARTNVRRG